MRKRVAYYAHQQGSGHLQHAKHLAETLDCELLIISEKRFDASDYPNVSYVQLPSDLVAGHSQDVDSVFHYTPNSPQIRRRFNTIASALQDFDPDVVIVDVSVEVLAFVKLLGYPVIHRLMHGTRTDAGHTLAYRTADCLIAYYPDTVEQANRQPWVSAKTTYVGMLQPQFNAPDAAIQNTVCALTSTGGEGVAIEKIRSACLQTPRWQWIVLGKIKGTEESLPSNCIIKGHVENPDVYLSTAEVIISSSGHNAVAQSAAHQKPLILIPEDRPYDEQKLFAEAISSHTDAMYIPSWAQDDWNTLLEKARQQDAATTTQILFTSPKTYGEQLLTAINAATNKDS